MRNIKQLLIDITRKPPMLFPFIGLFHCLWLIWVIWGLKGQQFGFEELIRIVWMLGYTVFWLAVCDLRRWGAWGYMGLTLIDAILFLSLKSGYDRSVYISSLFLIDGIFSFFLLFFYKRFT